MWPDQPYAEGRGSFLESVVPPIVDPDTAPELTLSISCAWLPYIRGALQQLLLQKTWKVTNDAELLLAQQRAATLIAMFVECSGDIPIACEDIFETFDAAGWTAWMGQAAAPNPDCWTWVSHEVNIVKTFGTPVDLRAVSFNGVWQGSCPGPAAAWGIFGAPDFTDLLVIGSPIAGNQTYSWAGSVNPCSGISIGFNWDSAGLTCLADEMRICSVSTLYVSTVGCQ